MYLPQYFPKKPKSILGLTRIALVSVFLLTACNDNQKTETLGDIKAPRMTMDLPVTLSGIVTAPNTSTKATLTENEKKQSADVVNDPSLCEKYFDPNDNFMENGFSMTRFLVGLSQSQSCFADFIMNAVVTMGANWVNQGLVQLPIDENDPNAPSHVQIEQTVNDVQVWLYFSAQGEALPADMTNVQTLYLTWSGNGDNVEGNYYMINMPLNPNDTDAPEGIRVDFARTETTANNKIFLKMRPGHSAGMDGFRIDVSQTGVNADASYTAKGLISFNAQPFPNVPAGLETPEFTATAIVDHTGVGASIANFSKFAFSIFSDTNNDGAIDPSSDEFDLGSYQFTIVDKTYFDPALYDATKTTIAYAEQVLEWRKKSAQNAIYVSTTPRLIPNAGTATSMLNCMENDGLCDYNGDGIQDSDEWMGWGLGTGYFSNTCMDDASITTECTSFVDRFFNDNQFASLALNSTSPEPSDNRNNQLDSVIQLSNVNPDSDPQGLSTFVIPDPPMR